MASDILNRVGMVITTTGTGPVTANVLISNRFNTPAEAGAVNGASYWWMLEEDNDYQIFEGVWTLSGTSVARTTTWMSKIGGVKGTANMNLAGNATLRSITPAEAFDFILRVDKDQTALFSSGQKTQGRSNIGAAKSGSNSDITMLNTLSGGANFTVGGVGATFANGSKVYDSSGVLNAIAAGNYFNIYNSDGSALIAILGMADVRLNSVPKIGTTNLLMQMSRADNGFLKFWDGTGYSIIQWGLATLAADGAVSFPTAFPNNCRQVVASQNGAPATTTLVAVAVGTKTSTGFNAYPRFTTGGTPAFNGNSFSYIAIGD
jgi:hypothetical protein